MPMKFIFRRQLFFTLILAAGFACAYLTGCAHFNAKGQPSEVRGQTLKVFSADPQTLAASKAALAAGDVTLRPALDRLLADADDRSDQEPVSVMDKKQIPPSGDKHDYISQAPYFWPNPNTSNGLPYINRDGQRNPEVRNSSDARNFADVCYIAHTLALAYYFSGDEKYAAKAAEFIRVWFLNRTTRMNPNLNYGQGIPGIVEGRAAGLITARGLAELVDALGLLAGSKSWTSNDQQGMIAWAGDYLQWLTTSKIGLDEDAALNNHGTYYDVQAVSLALFIGKTDFAREKLLAEREKRIAKQIEPDGKMPQELRRTLSFGYSTFNLTAEMQLADLGRNAGVDLWHYQTDDGRSILKAAEFMAPFANPNRAWPYQQIQKPNRRELDGLLLRAAAEFPESQPIKDSLKFLRPEDFADSPEQLYLKMARLPTAPEKVSNKIATIDHDRILRLANQALELKPPAITDQLATNSAGGLHDFFSQADYSWPNPNTTNGLPYVNRDGESYPGVFSHHRMAMRNMKDAVAALAAAYALTGDNKYVRKSAELLQVFFLDAQTRMNPNLQYAQAILGASAGREYGIIDTLHLAELPVAVSFLEKSAAFPSDVDKGLKKWFADYSEWITTSTNGMREMRNANNHSIACYLQLASFAKFTGDEKLLESCRERFKTVLFPKQMTNDGSFPLELKRTKPYGYSIFQADNVATMCVLLSTTNEDFWKFTLPDGGMPRNAVDFIYPYLADKNKWLADGHPKDVEHWDNWPMRQSCLIFAYAEFGDEKYFDLWKKLDPDPTDLEIRRNVAITQPLLWISSPEEVPLLKKTGD